MPTAGPANSTFNAPRSVTGVPIGNPVPLSSKALRPAGGPIPLQYHGLNPDNLYLHLFDWVCAPKRILNEFIYIYIYILYITPCIY